MRAVFVIPLILAALVYTASVHSYRKNNLLPEFYLDRTAKSLKGIDTVLPVTTNLACIWVGDSFDLTIYIYSRLILAPRYCIGIDMQKDDRKMDTVLCVCRSYTPDTVIHGFTNGRKILWQNEDTTIKYILTSTK